MNNLILSILYTFVMETYIYIKIPCLHCITFKIITPYVSEREEKITTPPQKKKKLAALWSLSANRSGSNLEPI